MKVGSISLNLGVVFRQVSRSSVWSARRHQHTLITLCPKPDLVQKVVDLPLDWPDFDHWIHEPRRTDDLLDHHTSGLRQFIRPRRRRNINYLVDPVLKLLECQRPVVERARHPESILDQILLARSVAVIHALDLRNRDVAFSIDEQERVLRQIIEQRRRSLSPVAARRSDANSFRSRDNIRSVGSSRGRTSHAG